MARQRHSSSQGQLKEDELVRSLAPDPSTPPDARVMVGFLGKSTRERHWRLHLTPNLSDYVEFAESDVLHSRPLEGHNYPLGGTAVWLKREANIVRTRSASREAQSDFLQGDISARYLAASGPLRTAVTIAPRFHAGGCLTGGQFDTLCVGCTAEPAAFVIPNIQRTPSPAFVAGTIGSWLNPPCY